MRPAATRSVSPNMRFDTPATLDRTRPRRRRHRVEADFVRNRFDACGVIRIRDEHDARHVPALEEPRRGLERLPRRAPGRLAQDRSVGDAVFVQIVGARARFGESVAGLPAAGDDDHRRDAARGTDRSRDRAAPRAPATAGRRTARRRAR